jgi:general secretion pathway protein E
MTPSAQQNLGREQADQLLELLVSRERLSQAQSEQARRIAAETHDKVPSVLLKLGLMSEEVLAQEQAFFMRWDLADRAGDYGSLDQSPVAPAFQVAHEVIIGAVGQQVTAICWDTTDDYVFRAVEFACGQQVKWLVATRSFVLEKLQSHSRELGESHERRVEFDDYELDRLKDLASEEPIIRLVQRIIDDAVGSKASDIHLEASDTGLIIRLRLDGMLQIRSRHSRELAQSVISRIKVMAGLNIAERRLPQDGRIRTAIGGREVDFRVATGPTLHGESVVLRILDRQDLALDFDVLGFDDAQKERLRRAIAKPHGIVLVTGPTGSGKTTTLYAALKEINSPERKILTIEDPVEYVLQGINQTAIRPQIGLTFANALRSFLRQDPDVMMVGEIRDRETAEIAIQAALTGHLLLSTLHTNTAAGAITRLLDMGIDDYLLTSTLDLIVGQRLVRKLCESCREPYLPGSDVLRRFQITTTGMHWYRAVGCSRCQGGYSGRTTLLESLPMSDGVRAQVLKQSDAHLIEAVAVSEGMLTLFSHGMDRVAAGVTTIDEVLRVTNLN